MERMEKQIVMEKEFVPYELAVKLKELGFDEECFGYYTELEDFVMRPHLRQQDCIEGKFSAPTWHSAFRWFREKYGLFVAPSVISYENDPYLWFFEINSTVLPFGTDLGETSDYKTYEEAELACLKKLISIVKEKQL